MIQIHHHVKDAVVIFILVQFLAIFLIRSSDAACTQRCGALEAPYPFGFSGNCMIQFSCSEEDGRMKLGDYLIKNITSDHVFVHLPANCTRPLTDLERFGSGNYAVTSDNSLLMERCHSPPSNCIIPSDILKSKLGVEECGAGAGAGGSVNTSLFETNITCYSGESGGGGFLNYEKVRNGCDFLLSSVVVEVGSDRDALRSSEVALDFDTVELEWWVDGECNCDVNADCVPVSPPGGGKGYRCRCKEGFDGDGFADGGGCRRDDCSAAKYMSGGCGGTTRVVVLIAGVIAGALLMAVIGLIWYCIHRRKRSMKNQLSAKRLLSEAAGGSSVPFFPYKEIERATNGFSEDKRLGTGAYGTVYAGKLHNDEWVAIKKIKHRDHESTHQVMNEIKLLSSLSHPNLVRLLGCCIEHGEQIIVYEYMPNGTLSQHLQRERSSGLPWTVRLTIAAETARAIAHLHTAINPPIYHRDIKSSNILLDYNFKSKVSDFGLSRFGMMDDSHISTAPQGTPGYLDPQYHQNYHLSDKSDVYSFGVVLVEIITALKVVDFSRPHCEINLAALAIDRIGKGRVDEIIDPLLEPHNDAWTLSSIHRVAELAFRCLAFHRDMRPSMIEVAEELEQIVVSGWAPLEENLYAASSSSSVASACSSPCSVAASKKSGSISSRRLIIPSRNGDYLPKMEESRESSPVSVQDPWLSEQSSPSANSLLATVTR